MDKAHICRDERILCCRIVKWPTTSMTISDLKENSLSDICCVIDRCPNLNSPSTQECRRFCIEQDKLTVTSELQIVSDSKKHFRRLREEKKRHVEFTIEEVKYLSAKVFREVYRFQIFNLETLKMDFFNFSLKSVQLSDTVTMCMRYRVCYGLIVRCKQLYFCPDDFVFKRLRKYFEWRRNVLSGFCFVKFRSFEHYLPNNCHSNFETLNRFCYDYYINKSTRMRFINLSRYLYFISKLLYDVFECRLISRSLNEE